MLNQICETDEGRVGYGISHWETPRGNYYGWRVSMALQFIPEFLFLCGVFFCPETYVVPVPPPFGWQLIHIGHDGSLSMVVLKPQN